MKIKKSRKWAAAFLLLATLPIYLSAEGRASGEPEGGLARSFSLALYEAPAARPAPPLAIRPAFGPTTPPSLAPFLLSAPSNTSEFAFKSIWSDFLKDAGQIWSYPVHIRTQDILPIVGLAALTGFLIANDEAIHRAFSNYRETHAWARRVGPVISRMGSEGAWGTAALFLAVGLIGGNDKSTETAVLASSAMLQSGILVTFLKGMFGRQRPYWADGVDHWSGPVGFFKRFGKGQTGRYDAFPGGHSITAFSLATVLAMQYRESVWVPIVAYTAATGVALSRVSLNKHWLSDCLVGGVLGSLIGSLVVRNHRDRYHTPPPAGGAPSKLKLAFSITL